MSDLLMYTEKVVVSLGSNIVSLGKIKLTVSATRLNNFLISVYTDFSDSAAGQKAQPGI